MTDGIASASAGSRPKRSASSAHALRLARRPEAGVLVAAIVVYLFFAYSTHGHGFVSLNGTANWLNLAAELGIIAVPVGLLMIAGEFDLSIGSVIGAASIIMALGTTSFGVSIWVVVAIAIGFGVFVGFINGVFAVRTGLPSFIVTLASNFIVAGAGLAISRAAANTTTISVTTTPLSKAVFAGRWEQANISILWWLAITAVCGLVLARTTFGNWIYATGGNPAAARAAGVPVARVRIILFVLTGAAAAFLGVLQAIEFNSGNASNGQGYIFQAPIAAVIGGVLLSGGYGSAFGVLVGAAIYGIISTGVFYTGWNTDWVLLFVGALLLLAVLANNYFRHLALRSM